MSDNLLKTGIDIKAFIRKNFNFTNCLLLVIIVILLISHHKQCQLVKHQYHNIGNMVYILSEGQYKFSKDLIIEGNLNDKQKELREEVLKARSQYYEDKRVRRTVGL